MEKTVSPALRNWLVANDLAAPTLTEGFHSIAVEALKSGKLSAAKYAELVADTHPENVKKPNARDAFVRVKGAAERYSNVKSVGRHIKFGQPILDEKGRQVELPSQLESAKAGALMKMLAARGGLPVEMTDTDKELLELNFADDWCGKLSNEWHATIPGSRAKALLNDTTSNGAELVPQYFDQLIVSYPLLHSEILPLVTLLEMPRGSSAEGAAINTPSASWGYAEGTGIPTFSTDSMVTSLTTPIFPVSVALEVGRDLLADAVDTLGRTLTDIIGQRMMAELDKVIVSGDGTTQPQGLTNASGTTDVGNPAGGSGADPQVADYETLLFSLNKAYRNPAMNCAYVGNDVTYRRARGIAVGGSDQRRVFGMDHSSYQLLEHPFRIQNDLANSIALFAALSRYRLYRRQGFSVLWETGGRELTLKNLALLVVRGRFGGRLIDPSAMVYSDSWKA